MFPMIKGTKAFGYLCGDRHPPSCLSPQLSQQLCPFTTLCTNLHVSQNPAPEHWGGGCAGGGCAGK